MTRLSSPIPLLLLISTCLLWSEAYGQMIGEFVEQPRLRTRQSGNGTKSSSANSNNNNSNNNKQNDKPDTSAFNIVNGRIFTPGLGIILSPQPFTPEGGDFLQVAIDVGGDGKLRVPPQSRDDEMTQIYNFTMFLTSNTMQKNFTMSNMTTATPPLTDIMNQESGQTVKHVNFEWPDCLVGDGKEDIGATARGDYNITIHQNFRLNGSNYYSIFNLPISVTNSIQQFPGANQLLSKPPPGPLSANGGRMSCDSISNPFVGISALIQSVNNPPGQPYQDIIVQTAQPKGGGQIGAPGNANPNGNGSKGGGTALGQSSGVENVTARLLNVVLVAVITVAGTTMAWR